MTKLTDSILTYLRMNSTGALMISGEWGCGKTYHIKHIVIPFLENKGYEPLMVSLFGIQTVDDIPLKIVESLDLKRTAKKKEANNDKNKSICWFSKKRIGKSAAKSFRLLSYFKWLGKYVDIKAVIAKYSEWLYRLVPSDKTVIIFDDMERVIDYVDIHMLLGVINGLVEQRGFKVVVIANNDYILKKDESKLVFKEKVIEKTLIYEPDLLTVFTEICQEGGYNSPFVDFMLDDKSHAVIDPQFPAYKNNRDLLSDLSNIRIVKFALSHFYEIYNTCSVFLKGEDTTISNSFLRSLWACVVGLSIEYKKNRLTYKEREAFATYVEVSQVEWQLALDTDGETEFFVDNETEKDSGKKEENNQIASKRVDLLFKTFLKLHELPVIVSMQVYDFIMAGAPLNKDLLQSDFLVFKGKVQRESKSPAYSLLQKFMHRQWLMTNEEMEEGLVNLLKFVEDGDFNDNMSYVNAATYLQHMQQLTTVTLDDIKKKIKSGINKMYSRIADINMLDKLNLDSVADQIPNISRWVLEYEREKMSALSSAKMKQDIMEVCRQFKEDLPALERRLSINYGSSKMPDFVNYPILKHISKEDIVNKIQAIQPEEVMALYHILSVRFQQLVSPDISNEELPFVRNLSEAISMRTIEKKVYADILIEDYLVKLVDKILCNLR